MSQFLAAVNQCLKAIGETPVASLESGLPDAEIAISQIEETSREVQSVGWHANTDYEITLTPDVDGFIRLAPTVMRADTTGQSYWVSVTTRTDPNDNLVKLFDIKNQTFVFTGPLICDLVHYFEFDSLPYALQNYIGAKAARVYQETQMGSEALDKFVTRREAEAHAILQDAESESEDLNVLRDNPHGQYITRRNNWHLY